MSRVPLSLGRYSSKRGRREGRFSNYCLELNGVNQSIVVTLILSPPVTVIIRLKPRTSNRYFFGAISPAGDGFYGQVMLNNTIRIYWVNTLAAFQFVASSNTIGLNRWNCVIVSLDGAGGTWRLYVNGVLTTAPYVGTPRVLTNVLRFGQYSGLTWTDGFIDEISAITRVITDLEARGAFLGGYARVLAGANLNLRLEEAAGVTAYDDSGAGNNGTLLNNPLWARVAKHELLAEAGV